MKFGRRYEMTVQGSGVVNTIQGPVFETHLINYPLTLQFDINRNVMATLNTGRFTLYNLKASTRNDIYHDIRDLGIYQQVVLKAGYVSQPNLPIIFKGNILSARSYRQGPNWLTEIECSDGVFGAANGQVPATMTKPAGWNFQDVVKSMLRTMDHVGIGTIEDLPSQNSRGISFSGNSWDALQNFIPDGVLFIDNEVANVLNPGSYVETEFGIPVINADSGLLNTPQRQTNTVVAEMIFEPRLVIGQRVLLQSEERNNNGFYKVSGIHHRGTISAAVGGEAVTAVTLFSGDGFLKAVAS